MKYTREEWERIREERSKWDWTLNDSELSRLHNVCRSCVQKLRVRLGKPAAIPKRTRVVLEPHVGAMGVIAVPSQSKQSGIYGWFNKVNQKWYVGQSIDVFTRHGNHRTALRMGEHFNVHLQDAWNLYGEAAFEFRLLEECASGMLDEKEVEWIAYTKSNNREYGYNYESGGKEDKHIAKETLRRMRDSATGRKRTPEQCAQLSAQRKGRPLTEKQKAQLTRLHSKMKGFKHSDETRRNMSIAQRKVGSTPAKARHVKKLHAMMRGRPSPNRGKRASPETCMKISMAKRGKPTGRKGTKASPELRKKLSLAHMGKRWTPEQTEKMRTIMKGRVFTPEHRAALSKAYHARKAMLESARMVA